MLQRLETRTKFLDMLAPKEVIPIVDWAEEKFYIEDPCDIETGQPRPPGPMRLFPFQKAILKAALARDGSGKFIWQTVVFSAIKKSGKTRVSAMVDCWAADSFGPFAEVYLAANDGKQSEDRLLSAIKKCLQFNPALGWRAVGGQVTLPDGSFIKAIPVNPEGQAGGNPTIATFSEMWGYRLEHKQRLWTALTISPVRRGKSIRWVDTYAGFDGESPILEDLYAKTVTGGRAYVDWADEHGVGYDPILREMELPLFVNEAGRMFTYWETLPRLPWQTPEYYEEEAANLPALEYRRIHQNEWVTSEDVFIPIEWWHSCEIEGIPPLQPREPVVLGVDAAVSGDSFAIVGVTRVPDTKENVAVRYSRVWHPPEGGQIDFGPIAEELRRVCKEHKVVEVAFDRYQLHQMATEMMQERVAYWREFSQQTERLESDTQLYQLIRERRVIHDGTHGELTRHISHCNSKMSKQEETKLRIVKSQRGKVDAAVALAMATHRCLYLTL